MPVGAVVVPGGLPVVVVVVPGGFEVEVVLDGGNSISTHQSWMGILVAPVGQLRVGLYARS